jgi:hypothetical protein
MVQIGLFHSALSFWRLRRQTASGLDGKQKINDEEKTRQAECLAEFNQPADLSHLSKSKSPSELPELPPGFVIQTVNPKISTYL